MDNFCWKKNMHGFDDPMSIFLSFRLNSGFLWRVESSVRRHFACHVEARCVLDEAVGADPENEYGISACNPQKSPWLKGNVFSKPIIFRLQPLVFRECIIFLVWSHLNFTFWLSSWGGNLQNSSLDFILVLVLGWLQVQSDHRPSLGDWSSPSWRSGLSRLPTGFRS